MIRIKKKNQSTKYFKLIQTITPKSHHETQRVNNNQDINLPSSLLQSYQKPICYTSGYGQQKSLRHTNAIIQKSHVNIKNIRKLQTIKLNQTDSSLNKDCSEEQEEILSQYQHCLINIIRINQLFRIGSFSKVYTANLTSRIESQLVVKKIQVDRSHVSREQEFAKILKSPYIVQFLGTYYTSEIQKQSECMKETVEISQRANKKYSQKENNGQKRYLNIVMKKYGNNLKQFLLSEKLQDKKLKIFLYQMIRALNYIHSMQICHRDIKPHNFVIKKSSIYLCDFGAAKIIPNEDSINSVSYIFSREYRPPELLLGFENYDLSVDVWALGCVAAQMVIKKPLFNGTNNLDQIIKILRVLGSPRWQTISFYKNRTAPKIPQIVGSGLSQMMGEDCDQMLIKLISRMLVIQPKQRITALQALTDPYFDQIRQQSFFRCYIKPLGLANLFYFNKRQIFGREEYLGKLIPYWVKQHCKRFQIDLKDYNF